MQTVWLQTRARSVRRGDSQVHSGAASDVARAALHQPAVGGVQELRKVRRRHQQPTATNNQPTLGDFFAIRNLTRSANK